MTQEMPELSLATPWLEGLVLLAAFFAVAWPAAAFTRRFLPPRPWVMQAVSRAVVLLLVIVAARVLRLDFDAMGLREPVKPLWGVAVGGGLLLGAVATGAILFSGSQGLRPVIGDLSFLQRAFLVFFLASVVEELYCRGVFQAWALADGRTAGFDVLLASACLFGAMHLGLLRAGVESRTVALLLPLLTALGLLAAWCRAESASVYPAIAAHVAFNVGGVLGGILFFVFSGRRPTAAS